MIDLSSPLLPSGDPNSSHDSQETSSQTIFDLLPLDVLTSIFTLLRPVDISSVALTSSAGHAAVRDAANEKGLFSILLQRDFGGRSHDGPSLDVPRIPDYDLYRLLSSQRLTVSGVGTASYNPYTGELRPFRTYLPNSPSSAPYVRHATRCNHVGPHRCIQCIRRDLGDPETLLRGITQVATTSISWTHLIHVAARTYDGRLLYWQAGTPDQIPPGPLRDRPLEWSPEEPSRSPTVKRVTGGGDGAPLPEGSGEEEEEEEDEEWGDAEEAPGGDDWEEVDGADLEASELPEEVSEEGVEGGGGGKGSKKKAKPAAPDFYRTPGSVRWVGVAHEEVHVVGTDGVAYRANANPHLIGGPHPPFEPMFPVNPPPEPIVSLASISPILYSNTNAQITYALTSSGSVYVHGWVDSCDPRYMVPFEEAGAASLFGLGYRRVHDASRRSHITHFGSDRDFAWPPEDVIEVDEAVRVEGGIFGKRVVGMAAGDFHIVFVTDDHQVYSCGANSALECGIISTRQRQPIQEPTLIPHLTSRRIVKAACGHKHSVFLSDTGLVYVCGDLSYGAIGAAAPHQPLMAATGGQAAASHGPGQALESACPPQLLRLPGALGAGYRAVDVYAGACLTVLVDEAGRALVLGGTGHEAGPWLLDLRGSIPTSISCGGLPARASSATNWKQHDLLAIVTTGAGGLLDLRGTTSTVKRGQEGSGGAEEGGRDGDSSRASSSEAAAGDRVSEAAPSRAPQWFEIDPPGSPAGRAAKSDKGPASSGAGGAACDSPASSPGTSPSGRGAAEKDKRKEKDSRRHGDPRLAPGRGLGVEVWGYPREGWGGGEGPGSSEEELRTPLEGQLAAASIDGAQPGSSSPGMGSDLVSAARFLGSSAETAGRVGPPPPGKRGASCSWCGAYPWGGTQRCARCRRAYYCCREHQALAWTAGHKAECVAVPKPATGQPAPGQPEA